MSVVTLRRIVFAEQFPGESEAAATMTTPTSNHVARGDSELPPDIIDSRVHRLCQTKVGSLERGNPPLSPRRFGDMDDKIEYFSLNNRVPVVRQLYCILRVCYYGNTI